MIIKPSFPADVVKGPNIKDIPEISPINKDIRGIVATKGR